MKKIAVVVMLSLVLGVVQPAFAEQVMEESRGLSKVVHAIGGGIMGFLLYGPIGACVGVGLMAIIDTDTGCFCGGGGGPCGSIIVY